jgi:hypothetical protein
MATESNNNSNGGFTGADAARGAVAALAGAALVALTVKKGRKARVLGVRVPREFTPSGFDAKKVARRIEHLAERVEKTSDDVRLASAQARRVSQRLT